MTIADRAARRLPPQAQDVLRRVLDNADPRRRRARREHADRSVEAQEFAARVSPGGVVLGGPFKGLRLPLDGIWGGLHARLAGTYELELFDAVEQIIAAQPEYVVDVGCAEGYYAVGFARRLPAAQVHAYDIDPQAQKQCRGTAADNAVTNVAVHGRIDPRLLNRQLSGSSAGIRVVIADCEGYEVELIDPVAVPELVRCTLLVELHEFCTPGVTAAVRERFATTHEVTLIDAVSRDGVRPAHLSHLDDADADRAVQEGRDWSVGPQQWAYLTPRT